MPDAASATPRRRHAAREPTLYGVVEAHPALRTPPRRRDGEHLLRIDPAIGGFARVAAHEPTSAPATHQAMEYEPLGERDERDVSDDRPAAFDPDAIARAEQRAHRDAARADLERTGGESCLEPAAFSRTRESRTQVLSRGLVKRRAHAETEAVAARAGAERIPNA